MPLDSTIFDGTPGVTDPLDYASIERHQTGNLTVAGNSISQLALASAANVLNTVAASGQRLEFTSAHGSASGVTIGTNEFTVTKAGRYRVDATCHCETQGANVALGIQIIKNGTVNLGYTAQYPGTQSSLIGVHTNWEANLSIGDTIDVRLLSVGAASTASVHAQSINVREQPVATTVDPGDVAVTPLDFCHARALTAQSIANNTDTLILLDGVVADSSGLFSAAGNRVTLAKSGRYRVRGRIPWASSGNSGALGAVILVNGNAVLAFGSTRNNTDFAMTEVDVVADLAAGNYLQLRARQQTGAALSTILSAVNFASVNPELEVTELPTSTVVDPGLVPVQSMHWARWQLAANAANTTFAAAPAGTNLMPLLFAGDASGFGIVTDATNIVCAQSGRYRFDWMFNGPSGEFARDGEFSIYVNGVFRSNVFFDMMQAAGVNQSNATLTVDLNINDLVQFRYAGDGGTDAIVWGKGSYLHVQQIPSSTLTLPDSVTASDNASGGYFDIGTMRMQWGVNTQGITGARTVTLPAPFANANYVVTASGITASGAGSGRTVNLHSDGKTTTQFGARVWTTTNTADTPDFSWHAIGIKP